MSTILPIAFWLGLAFQGDPPEGRPEIVLRKPAADSTEVAGEAAQRVGAYRVPWVRAKVEIKITGFKPLEIFADLLGKFTIPLHKIWLRSRSHKGPFTIQATVRTRTQAASAKIDLTWEEINARIDRRVGQLRAEAKAALEKGEPARALAAARALLAIVPVDPEGFLLLARAHDAQGNALPAVVAYREFLLSPQTSPERHRRVKERVIANARKLKEPPPIPEAAYTLLEAAERSVAAGKWDEAVKACRKAQRVAPWWDETYLRAALLRTEHWLSVRAGGKIDLEDFELLLLFGGSSKKAEEVRPLYKTVKELQEKADRLSRKWEKVKALLKKNREILKKGKK